MLENLRCKPGAYIEIVPIGLLCTLQYNENGILQRIICGFDTTLDENVESFNSKLSIQLKSEEKIPARIPFTQGTTWIKGVFYTSTKFNRNGTLPGCIQKDMLRDLEKNFESYDFYAVDMYNDSYKFVGGSLIHTRLSTFGFKAAPGYQVFDEIPMIPIAQIMRDKNSPFEFPYVSGMLIYNTGAESAYVPLNLSQHTVTKVDEYLEEHGYIRAKVSFSNASVDVSFTEIANYDITPKSTLILDEGKIVASRKPTSYFNTKVSRDKGCSICHRKLVVPHVGETYCSDPHCLSKMYPNVKQFLNVLNLAPLSFEQYMKYIQDESITCLLDLLSLDEYKDQIIECTLSKLLFAAVPVEVCRGEEFFQQFANTLGSIEALDFYLNNPDTIVTDLEVNKRYAKNFADWLKDPENLLMIRTLISMEDQIKIQPVSKKFEGDPIFHNKTICLTGKFKHGTLEDVMSILKSYSAKVTTKFDNTVNCVIVGHFEGEDTRITDLAVSYNVPIYGEDDFFKAYDIDSDIWKTASNTVLP